MTAYMYLSMLGLALFAALAYFMHRYDVLAFAYMKNPDWRMLNRMSWAMACCVLCLVGLGIVLALLAAEGHHG